MLPRSSFRTYHPNYLRRAGEWYVLDLIVRRVRDDLSHRDDRSVSN